MRASAILSEDRLYRFELTREGLLNRTRGGRLDPQTAHSKGTVMFLMLNPSTADESEDDATIRRCIGYATGWGFDRLVVCNLSPYRATAPRDMISRGPEPTNVWEQNEAVVIANALNADLMVAAWGTKGNIEGRASRMVSALTAAGVPLSCLGLSKDGHPFHPLMQPKDAELVPFRP